MHTIKARSSEVRTKAAFQVDITPHSRQPAASVMFNRAAHFLPGQPSPYRAANIVLTHKGPHFIVCSSQSEFLSIDIVIIGDGELIARDSVSGKPIEEISNSAFKKIGDIIQTPFQFIDVVDDSIYPKRSLKRYSYELGYKWLKTGKHVDMITS
jgi:hypothetical protein